MARETTQQDKRTQAKGRNAQAGRNGQTGRGKVDDRQTTIQTDRDSGRADELSQGSQTRSTQGSQQNTSRDQGQQAASGVARSGGSRGGGPGGMRAPIRGSINNPYTMLQRMSEDMDRLFEQFGFGRTGLGTAPSFGSQFGSSLGGRGSSFGGGADLWAPQVETIRRGDKLVIRADLPGINRDDVSVEIDNDVLTLSGERKNEREEERDGFYRSERSYGRFFRAIPLPEGTDTDQCEARFNDGVLEISVPVPKQGDRSTKRIEVR